MQALKSLSVLNLKMMQFKPLDSRFILILDLFLNAIRLLKLTFLASSSQNFSTMCLHMRSSHYLKSMLFVSFFTSFTSASWPTYSSMSCEAALKSVNKSFKNQYFQNSGMISYSQLLWSAIFLMEICEYEFSLSQEERTS